MGRIRSVQALRAFAALFVVANHATVLWANKFDPTRPEWANGNAGVDLFFVISGFIIVVSSRRLVGLDHGWRRFAMLRLVRIVPLYWLMTLGKLAGVAAAPGLALHTRPSGWNIIASFLFIPSRDLAGDIRPVLPVGWTLSYEMLFYFAFGVALFLGVDALLVVVPAMVALALLSFTQFAGEPAIYSLADPMVLEFVFGVLIGRAFLSQALHRVASPILLPVGALALICLAVLPSASNAQRVLMWGLPAAVALCVFVAGEHRLDRWLPNWMVRIGEASYALYLSHGFVLPVLGAVAARLHLTGWRLGTLLVGGGIVASTAVALVLYAVLERPMTNALRRLVGDGDVPRPELPAALVALPVAPILDTGSTGALL